MRQGAINIGDRDRALAAGLMLVALAALVYATQVLPSLAPLHPVIPAPYSALSRFLALLLIVPFAALVLRGRGRSGGASVTSAPIMALALVFNHLLPSSSADHWVVLGAAAVLASIPVPISLSGWTRNVGLVPALTHMIAVGLWPVFALTLANAGVPESMTAIQYVLDLFTFAILPGFLIAYPLTGART